MGHTKIYRYNGTTWDEVATVPGSRTIIADENSDTLYLVTNDPSNDVLYRINLDDTVETVHDCSAVTSTYSIDYCKGRQLSFFTHSDGAVTYVITNVTDNRSRLVRVKPGSPAELVADFPIPLDQYGDVVQSPHSFGYGFADNGDFFVVRGSNVTVEGHLHYLAAGDDQFQQVTEWGHGSFTVYVPIIGAGGTVYAFNTEGPLGVLK